MKVFPLGEHPLVEDLNKFVIRSAVIWYSSFSTPVKRALAACSAVSPSSVDSILRVIAGLVLFSSSYPGVYIVQGKKMWVENP